MKNHRKKFGGFVVNVVLMQSGRILHFKQFVLRVMVKFVAI